jgi:hypothetical protein
MKNDLTTGTWQDDIWCPINIILFCTSDDTTDLTSFRLATTLKSPALLTLNAFARSNFPAGCTTLLFPPDGQHLSQDAIVSSRHSFPQQATRNPNNRKFLLNWWGSAVLPASGNSSMPLLLADRICHMLWSIAYRTMNALLKSTTMPSNTFSSTYTLLVMMVFTTAVHNPTIPSQLFHLRKSIAICPWYFTWWTPIHDSLELHGFVDADWATCPKTCHCFTGVCIWLAGGTIASKCKLQPTIAQSSTEAEFTGASDYGQMILFIWSILWDIGIPQEAATILYKDNNACIVMAMAQKPMPRTHHMDI